MEQTCFICKSKATLTDKLLVVECNCPNCGKYAYEKNFVTAYNYYIDSFNKEHGKALEDTIKNIVKKGNICFVDDFETSLVEGYNLLEFRDILNMAGIDLAHNNTIDSNWTD